MDRLLLVYSEEFDIPGGGKAAPLELTPQEAEQFESDLVEKMEADKDAE
ncbi:MAG: hypothetical protein ABL959_18240 [Pyrinomonadaceae bacterium]